MVLSQREIREAVENGQLVFDPSLEEKQWGPTSVDLRLGFDFTKIKLSPGLTVSVAEGLPSIRYDTKVLKERDELGKPENCILKPTEFILARTYETVTIPHGLIGLVEGRSSYARIGLSMHQTAPWIHPGYRGKITLEIRNSGPLDIMLIPLLDRPCQLTFFKLTSEVEDAIAYGAKESDTFQDQVHPLEPRLHDK